MKLLRSFLAANLILSLFLVSFLTIATQNTPAQSANVALQRGYRTGYSDGYMEGYRDVINNAAKNIGSHAEYASADRAYVKDYGELEDYRDGYRQGFESGYEAGFGKQSFDSTLPASLSKRGVKDVPANPSIIEPVAGATIEPESEEPPALPTQTAQTQDVTAAVQDPTASVTYEPRAADDIAGAPVAKSGQDAVTRVTTAKASYQYPALNPNDIIVIPAETELIVELLDPINTERNREGDTFKARVVSPAEITGAVIEGRIDKIRRPGHIKRRAELLLAFDRIILAQSRWSNFNAIVTEVLPVKGDNVKRVDVEGTVEGDRPFKSDATKVGASAGAGMLVGGLIGGPVGVAIGAGVGAAFGVGAVVVERGKHINLVETQQLRIKSSFETQIR